MRLCTVSLLDLLCMQLRSANKIGRARFVVRCRPSVQAPSLWVNTNMLLLLLCLRSSPVHFSSDPPILVCQWPISNIG